MDVSCSSHAAAGSPLKMSLSAWTIKYPYFEDDSSFTSDNQMLNRVWALCQNTLRVTSLDAATDSNTRERLPYEADGYITGLSRLALQREFSWPRHSWHHNINNPTWPTEWRQTITFFAHTDYLHSGSTAMFEQFRETMEAQSQLGCVNTTTQLVDFSTCSRATGGFGAANEAQLKDIVDWPGNSRDGFVLGPVNTVISSYMVGNLKALAELYSDVNMTHSQQLIRQANATRDALNHLAVSPITRLYADGLDSEARPLNHSAWHATVFPAAFGLAPEDEWPAALADRKSVV